MMKHGKELEVTDVYRSDDEHRRLLRRINVPYYPTPHSDYRAIDFIITGGTPEIYEDIEDYANILHPYGKGNYKTALYQHPGTGVHIHLQCRPGTV